MTKPLHYRPDIDGLRGLAILLVVLFHLDVQGFNGGFVGVDIFFVISGFLITAIVHRDVIEGRFSYAEFYERRIRRLLPALIAVLGATFIAAWLLLLPLDFRTFSHGLTAASLFVANIYYWNTTDYFGDPIEQMPLLHTWSLSVEEQFYLFFPPLLLFLLKIVPKKLNIVILAVSLLSLAAAQSALHASPESSFYLVHLRAWELLAGALLALGAAPRVLAPHWRNILVILGLLLIFFSAYPLDKNTPFPGVNAVPTVLGAAMIIHAGSHSGSSMMSRMLSWRPLIYVGLISYSLYLWHWPLFVLARYYLIEPLHGMQKVVLLFIAVMLAWISWRFLERPFRGKSGLGSRQSVFGIAGSVTILFVALGLPGSLTSGAAFRIPGNVDHLAAVAKEDIPFKKDCFGLSFETIRDGNVCRMGAAEKNPAFILWGDSHALAMAPGIDEAARQANVGGVFLGKSTCPPAMGVIDFKASRHSCREFNREVAGFLNAHPTIRTAILVARWSRYTQEPGGISSNFKLVSVDESGWRNEVTFEAGLRRTLNLLQQEGIRVVIVQEVPDLTWDVPSVLARAALYDRDLPESMTLEKHLANTRLFRNSLQTLSADFDFRVISLERLFCPEGTCKIEVAGHPLYRDSHHLSRYGAGLVANKLSTIFSSGAAR